MRELIIDSFAGGGGASTGIEKALGRSPDIAINHDAVALSVHAVNHPKTQHLPHNVWKVDPTSVCQGRPVGLLWASPDCKHFSKAKGGRPVEQNIRDLAWVVVRWAKQVGPRVIFLENVEEFATWGPLGPDNRPCKDRSGFTFKRWVRELRRLGYKVDWRELRAADFGAPTIRRRLFLIARRDGLPIVWPKPTHMPLTVNEDGIVTSWARGHGLTLKDLQALKPWRTAAEIIDWSLPCPSIFDTSAEIFEKFGVRAVRPLAENTMARIARGVDRYVINAADPFIVPITHTGDERVHGLDEPVRTVTTAHRGEHALVQPFVVGVGSRAGQSPERGMDTPFGTVTATKRGQHALVTPLIVKNYHGDKPHYPVDEPTRTILTGQHHMLVAPTLIQTGYGERPGQSPRVPGLDVPLGTVVNGQKHALVAAFLAQHNTDMVGHSAQEPLSTIVGKGCTQAVVSAGLVSLKGTGRRSVAPAAPVPAITAGGFHVAEVRAFLMKYHRDGGQAQECHTPLGTGGTRDRFGVVTVSIGGESFAIADIGMRMLTPRELFRAQGFADGYIIDRTADGTPVSKTDQIRLCGNSVCPDVAAALVAANYVPMEVTAGGVPEFALAAAE